MKSLTQSRMALPLTWPRNLATCCCRSISTPQIAEEAGEFTLEDVIEHLTAKLVRRHPHVFGERTIETAGEVVKAWDQIKQEERSGDEPETAGISVRLNSSISCPHWPEHRRFYVVLAHMAIDVERDVIGSTETPDKARIMRRHWREDCSIGSRGRGSRRRR